MIQRTDDFSRLNGLMNDPLIYPWVKGDLIGELDASALKGSSIALSSTYGMFWFVCRGNGVYEAHTLYPPGAPDTFPCALEAIDYVRSLPGYKKIVTQRPRNNPRALRFLEKLNFRYTHTDGTYQGYPLDHYEYI